MRVLNPHCRRGHEWTEENTYVRRDTNLRVCRECQRIRSRRKPMSSRMRLREPRRRIITAAGGRCAYCGEKTANTLDHVVPHADRRRYEIAEDDEAYLVACCLTCNVNKGTRRLTPKNYERIKELQEIDSNWREWDGNTRSAAYRDTHL